MTPETEDRNKPFDEDAGCYPPLEPDSSSYSSDCSDVVIEFESRDALLATLCEKAFGAKPIYQNMFKSRHRKKVMIIKENDTEVGSDAVFCDCVNWCRADPTPCVRSDDGLPIMTNHHPRCERFNDSLIEVWKVTDGSSTYYDTNDHAEIDAESGGACLYKNQNAQRSLRPASRIHRVLKQNHFFT